MKNQKRKPGNRRPPKKNQDVVYTQPKAFNSKRLVLQLATVAAVVLALLFGLSIFFKVGTVEVSGTVKYDAWTVRQASGIRDGENLLTLDKNSVSANILDNLPYVSEVQVGRKLPGTVVIEVTEMEVAYPAQDAAGDWWLLSAEGRIIDTCSASDAEDMTKILGVKLDAPAVGSMAKAYEEPAAADENGTTIPVTVYNQERLNTALSVIEALEQAGFVGSMDSVDVTKINELQLWYDGRFQILLGDTSQLVKKLNALAQTLEQMEKYNTGILDIRFTKYPDEVRYSQFS